MNIEGIRESEPSGDATGVARSPRFTATMLVIAFVASMALASCGANAQQKADTGAAKDSAAPAAAAPRLEDFDAARFANPTEIDNAWMPIHPGMRFTYDGVSVEDDGTVVPHRIVITYTDLIKKIGNVPSRVSWDLDYSDGELVEAELAFFAQDDAGNVWRMGEYPEEYEDKKMIGNPGWIHGIEDARAGIMMQAQPATGTPDYSQGWGPKVKWTDRATVDSMGVKTCVKLDCYDDVLVVSETSQSEVNAEQLKYYARSLGNVRVGWRGAGEKVKEVLELTKVERLDAKELAKVRTAALKLEKSGYENSKLVYGKTTPIESPGEGP